MPSMITAQTYKQAMDNLRKGKITPDEFRAIARASREQNGAAEHDRIKALAVASSNRHSN